LETGCNVFFHLFLCDLPLFSPYVRPLTFFLSGPKEYSDFPRGFFPLTIYTSTATINTPQLLISIPPLRTPPRFLVCFVFRKQTPLFFLINTFSPFHVKLPQTFAKTWLRVWNILRFAVNPPVSLFVPLSNKVYDKTKVFQPSSFFNSGLTPSSLHFPYSLKNVLATRHLDDSSLFFFILVGVVFFFPSLLFFFSPQLLPAELSSHLRFFGGYPRSIPLHSTRDFYPPGQFSFKKMK